MPDTVVRLRRRHPSPAAARASATQAALFAVMVAPTVLLWAFAVHAVLVRR